MTTQSEQNELEDILSDICQTCEECNHPRCLSIIKSVKAVIHQRELSLLDEVEKRVIGDPQHQAPSDKSAKRVYYQNALRRFQLIVLNAMRKERS